jgi:hypothetical protein
VVGSGVDRAKARSAKRIVESENVQTIAHFKVVLEEAVVGRRKQRVYLAVLTGFWQFACTYNTE